MPGNSTTASHSSEKGAFDTQLYWTKLNRFNENRTSRRPRARPSACAPGYSLVSHIESRARPQLTADAPTISVLLYVLTQPPSALPQPPLSATDWTGVFLPPTPRGEERFDPPPPPPRVRDGWLTASLYRPAQPRYPDRSGSVEYDTRRRSAGCGAAVAASGDSYRIYASWVRREPAQNFHALEPPSSRTIRREQDPVPLAARTHTSA
ncbi:hypothetical protein DL767_002857 [Monosporascus sp. MG133]|nr:hypothetical protein DL767_002857 [Monosporascus sp. MG133]